MYEEDEEIEEAPFEEDEEISSEQWQVCHNHLFRYNDNASSIM